MPEESLVQVIEAALLAAGRPLTLDQLCDLYVTAPPDSEEAKAERDQARKPIRAAIKALQAACEPRGIELVEVASGYRFQVKQAVAERVSHLWAARPTRYSRALLETLALIAYRQPITRGEIESVRGVSVSTQIIASLLEFGWIRIVGYRNTPGRPKLYGTTKAFLDQFSLQSLQDLPPLPEVQQLSDALQGELPLALPPPEDSPVAPEATESAVEPEIVWQEETPPAGPEETGETEEKPPLRSE